MKHNHTLLNFALSFFWLSSLSITLARKPFAEDCLEQAEAGKPWTVEQVQEHYIKTIGVFKAKDSVPVKDNAGVESHLSHVTNVVNKKDKDKQWIRTKFTGVMDFTKLKKGTIMLAVHVDDIAELSIESKEANIYRELRCNGGALWNPRSFKKFPYAIQTLPVGYKYEYTITYVNSSNLNNHKEYKPKARQDVDGLNVFVAIIPSVKPELVVPHLAINDADRNQDHIYDHDQPQIPGDIGSLQLLNFSLGGPEKAKATGTLTLEILTPEYARFRGDDDKHSTLPNPVQHTIRYEKGTGESNYVYLEGLKTTPDDRSLMIKATWEGDNGDLEEVVGNAGVYGVDLDIDSLNVKNFKNPYSNNQDEVVNRPDKYELAIFDNKQEKISKIIFNNGGSNSFGVPAFAAGYRALEENPIDRHSNENAKGVPIELYLPQPYNPDDTIIQLEYLESYPELTKNSPLKGGVILSSIDEDGDLKHYYSLKKSGLRIWAKNLDELRSKKSVDKGGDYIPNKKNISWKALLRKSSSKSNDNRRLTLFVEYVWKPGSSDDEHMSIGFSIKTVKKEKNVPTTKDVVFINALACDIIPDFDRDGKITENDRGKIDTKNPYRFWLNDDSDKFGEGKAKKSDDLPAFARGPRNFENNRVDGIRDLVDFFPLQINLKSILKKLPKAQKNEYRFVLKQKDNGKRL